jgi:glycosyltransferase involved in cell wall biosynthesis
MQLPAVTGDPAMTAAGWLEGLRWALEKYEPEIELGICSWGPVVHEPFCRGNATYFSLRGPRPRTRLQRIEKAWKLFMVPPDAVDDAVHVMHGFDPDVVHVQGTEHPLGLAALRVPYPAVATLQGIVNAIQPFVLDHVPHSEIARGVPTREFIRGDSYIHTYLRMKRSAALERTIVRGLHRFIGQTPWDRGVLRLLNPSAEYHECPRVLQSTYYDRRWQGPPAGTSTIFCTSGPGPYKGLETLMEGMGLLRDAGFHDVRLTVAGDITDSFVWPMLSRLIKRRRLENMVVWSGALTADRLAVELERSSLFVLPSHIENESNALIEAMLAGIPCVASSVGGVPSVLRDGIDGILYHDSDPFALAGALARLIDDPQLARRLGCSARERAQARYAPDVGARSVKAVYEQIIHPSSLP